eukprot:1787835-Rhodomonas_salina.5
MSVRWGHYVSTGHFVHRLSQYGIPSVVSVPDMVYHSRCQYCTWHTRVRRTTGYSRTRRGVPSRLC